MMMQYMAKLKAKVDQVVQSNQASIHNLETQVGQLAKAVSERTQRKLPSNTEVNPKEGVMAITLRSGRLIEPVQAKKGKEKVQNNDEIYEEQLK